MNNCILTVEVVQDPQLRYTADTQTAIAEMLVRFPGLRADDPPATVRVTGWGNLAQEIQEQYRLGDRLVIEGRLSMNTIERPEGFKEKRADVVAQRIYRWGDNSPPNPAAVSESSSQYTPSPAAATPKPASPPAPALDEPDYDDIPF